MSLLEDFVAEINRSVYYAEFSFTKNNFSPLPGQTKEFADHVIWIDELLMLFQIKERTLPHADDAAAAKWFRSEVIRTGTRQVRDTLRFLQEYPSITIENQRGHRFDVAQASVKRCVKIVLYFGGADLPEMCRSVRHHQSQTAGFIHVMGSPDYFQVSRTLLTPVEIVEYLEFRERVINRHVGSGLLPSEDALLGQYLCGDLGAQPSEQFSQYLVKLRQEPTAFDLSGFLGALGDHLIDGEGYTGGTASYYPILAEFAKLTRLDLAALKERFLKVGRAADADHCTLPYRIVSSNSSCGFIIVPITSRTFQHRLSLLKKLTLASKYECRVTRHVGVAVSRQGGGHLVEWVYAEGPWTFDERVEAVLRDCYPFRPLRAEGRYRYDFE
ncbi:MAG: hypothetical protein ABR961_11635 [Thermoanaerobaculaceae bacterium]